MSSDTHIYRHTHHHRLRSHIDALKTLFYLPTFVLCFSTSVFTAAYAQQMCASLLSCFEYRYCVPRGVYLVVPSGFGRHNRSHIGESRLRSFFFTSTCGAFLDWFFTRKSSAIPFSSRLFQSILFYYSIELIAFHIWAPRHDHYGLLLRTTLHSLLLWVIVCNRVQGTYDRYRMSKRLRRREVNVWKRLFDNGVPSLREL